MKLPALLLTTLILAPVPVFAGPGHRGGRVVHYERNCYKNVEKYVPGWYDKHGRWNGGYVEHRKKRVFLLEASSPPPLSSPSSFHEIFP